MGSNSAACPHSVHAQQYAEYEFYICKRKPDIKESSLEGIKLPEGITHYTASSKVPMLLHIILLIFDIADNKIEITVV